MRRLSALLACAVACGAAHAAPYVPASDAVVLEKAQPRVARALSAPLDLDAAVAAARLEVQMGQRQADPRHFGRAQALLAAWWESPRPPAPVLLLRATIRQSLHDFAGALADLQILTREQPGNAQAWLVRATVEQVSGDLPAAARSCTMLRASMPYAAAVCAASVDSSQGRAQAALMRLSAIRAASAPAALQAWAASIEGEIAQRVGLGERATEAYLAALARDPDDIYTRAAYADLLLDEGRPDDVLRLVEGRTQADALLLRAAIAARRLGRDNDPAIAAMGERFMAARERGDRTHLREASRYELQVRGDAAQALALACENWRQQREPADARVALEAAAAAGRGEQVREVLDFVAANRLEDTILVDLSARLRRA